MENEFSGLEEVFLTTSNLLQSSNQTSKDYTSSDSIFQDISFFLLLLIIISSVTLLLVLCILIYFCSGGNFTRQSNYKDITSTFVVSKSTSVTGLNESQNVHVVQQSRPSAKQTIVKILNCENKFNHKFHSSACLTNYTLDLSNESLIESLIKNKTKKFKPPQVGEWKNCRHNNGFIFSDAPVTEDQTVFFKCEDCKRDLVLQTKAKETNKLFLTMPSAFHSHDSIEWTANIFDSTKDVSSSSSVCDYDTASSYFLNHYNTSKQSDNFNVSNSNIPSTTSELSPISASGVTSSLPIDVHGHPRAWFVPLHEMHYQPLRHSYVDDTDQCTTAFTLNDASDKKDSVCSKDDKNKLKDCLPEEFSICKENFDPPAEFNGSEVGDSNKKSSECGLNWRDSGIPTSQFNLRSFSSDLDKKPSLWEQREGRPVVFLQDTETGTSVSMSLTQQNINAD